MGVPAQEERERIFLPLPFCFIRAVSGLDSAHPHWGGRMALLSLLNQTLISFRNTLKDPHGNVLGRQPLIQSTWQSIPRPKGLGPVKPELTYRFYHLLAVGETCSITLSLPIPYIKKNLCWDVIKRASEIKWYNTPKGLIKNQVDNKQLINGGYL